MGESKTEAPKLIFRNLNLGERIVVNLSQMGLPSTCVGMVTELETINGEADRGVVYATVEGLPVSKLIQLLPSARQQPWGAVGPGQWCSIESLHTSMGSFF